jgi:hypothetical protein
VDVIVKDLDKLRAMQIWSAHTCGESAFYRDLHIFEI